MFHGEIINSGDSFNLDALLVITEEPDQFNPENFRASFQKFEDLRQFINKDINDPLKFHRALQFWMKLYNQTKPSLPPIWRISVADVIFNMYISTIPESGLPLSHPHIK